MCLDRLELRSWATVGESVGGRCVCVHVCVLVCQCVDASSTLAAQAEYTRREYVTRCACGTRERIIACGAVCAGRLLGTGAKQEELLYSNAIGVPKGCLLKFTLQHLHHADALVVPLVPLARLAACSARGCRCVQGGGIDPLPWWRWSYSLHGPLVAGFARCAASCCCCCAEIPRACATQPVPWHPTATLRFLESDVVLLRSTRTPEWLVPPAFGPTARPRG